MRILKYRITNKCAVIVLFCCAFCFALRAIFVTIVLFSSTKFGSSSSLNQEIIINNVGDKNYAEENHFTKSSLPFVPNHDTVDYNDTILVTKETASACLLVCDDNHFLIEWIAYHYFVVDLRHLIVTSDPKCLTKPDHILDRWRNKITIEYWGEERFMKKGVIGQALELHRARQMQFNVECLRTLKRKNASWVFLTDTDEFVKINPKLKGKMNSSAELQKSNKLLMPGIREPGSVMTFLKSISYPSQIIGMVFPCLPIHRVQFSAQESSIEEVKHGLSASIMGDFFDYKSFLTLRWHKRVNIMKTFETILGDVCPLHSSHRANIPGKVAIDLSRLRLEELYNHKIKGNAHRPLESICMNEEMWRGENDTGLVIHHYLGTKEQFFYRSTDSRGESYRRERYEKLNTHVASSESDLLKPWLEGFIELVGKNEAALLLKGVGELEPIPGMRVQHIGRTHKPGGPTLDSAPTLVDKNYKAGHLVQVRRDDITPDKIWHWAQIVGVTKENTKRSYDVIIFHPLKCYRLSKLTDSTIRVGLLSDITEEKVRLKYMQQNNIKQ